MDGGGVIAPVSCFDRMAGFFVPTAVTQAGARSAGPGWPQATAQRRASVLDRCEHAGSLRPRRMT